MPGSIACSAQAIHDCHTYTLFREGFSHHHVHFTLIKLPKSRIEIGGGLSEIPGWTQDNHLCEAGGDFLQRFAKCQKRSIGLGKNLLNVRFKDKKFLFWGVMTGKTSRCIHNAPTPTQPNNMSTLIQIILSNRSWAQDLHRITCHGEDRRFQSMGATPPIKDQWNNFTKLRLDILSRDRTDSPESVRTRGSQWRTKPTQDLLEEGMGSDSDGNSLGTSRDQIGNFGMLVKNQSQGAGPKGGGQIFRQPPLLQRSKPDNSIQPSDFRKMNDQGVGQGATLGLKDPGNSQ